MTLCPIALAVGCKKCPAFSVCPLKEVVGDYKPDDEQTKQHTEKAPGGAKRGRVAEDVEDLRNVGALRSNSSLQRTAASGRR